jgi:hypothetical protein
MRRSVAGLKKAGATQAQVLAEAMAAMRRFFKDNRTLRMANEALTEVAHGLEQQVAAVTKRWVSGWGRGWAWGGAGGWGWGLGAGGWGLFSDVYGLQGHEYVRGEGRRRGGCIGPGRGFAQLDRKHVWHVAVAI